MDEAWKGPRTPTILLDVEGGTIGAITLTVSDMKSIEAGERGVFFIERSSSGRNVPHRRGLGMLKLNAAGVVTEEGRSLDQIRAEILGQGGQNVVTPPDVGQNTAPPPGAGQNIVVPPDELLNATRNP